MRRLDPVFAWIVLALGIIHISVTPLVYSSFSQGAVWFAGAGLAGLFAGMLNLIRVRHASAVPALRAFSLVANVLLLAWVVAGAISMLSDLHRNPQAFILLIAVVGETLFSANKGPSTIESSP